MAKEARSLRRLNWLVVGLGFVLVVVSMCGFLILEYYLYFTVLQGRL